VANSIGYLAQVMITNLPHLTYERSEVGEIASRADLRALLILDNELDRMERELRASGKAGSPLDAARTHAADARADTTAPGTPGRDAAEKQPFPKENV
jgi:hypothetical protein